MANTTIKINQLTTGVDGELITWDSSGNPTTVATGIAGHVLTSNGAGNAPSFQAPTGADGNGIYSGSGTVPSSVVATLTDTLTFTGDVANTNTAATRLVIQTNSTGTPTTGFGGGILFQGESSTTTNRDMARITSAWTNATDANREAKLSIELGDNGGALSEVAYFNRVSSTAGTFGVNGTMLIGSSSTATVSNTAFTPGTTYTFGGGSSSVSLASSATASSTAVLLSASGNNVNASGTIGSTNFTTTTGNKYGWRMSDGYAPVSGTGTFTNLFFNGTINQTGGSNGITRNILLSPTLTSIADYRGISFTPSYTASSGSAITTALDISPTYNLTGSASGIQRGIRINPTFTALSSEYRAIDIAPDGVSIYGIYQSGVTTSNLLAGTTYIGGGSTPSELRFYEGSASGTNYTGFSAPATLASNQIYVLPSDTPADGDVLTWNTGGTLSWEPAGGSDGNGIYSGSGSIPTSTAATVASTGDFAINYNNTQFALSVLDNYGITLGSDNAQVSLAVVDTEISALTPYLEIGNSTTNQGQIRLLENATNGTNYVGIQAAAAMDSDDVYTLPADLPTTTNQFLTSTTGGVMSWLGLSGLGGIYSGSGTISPAAVATLTAASSFTFDYSDGSNALVFNDTGESFILSAGSGYGLNANSYTIQMTGPNSDYFSVTSAGPTARGGLIITQGHLALVQDITPTQITADQNNYAPTGIDKAAVVRLSSDASRTITGIAKSTASDGDVLTLINVGSNDIILSDENVLSTDVNRFVFGGGDVTLSADTSITLIYDDTSNRWRAFNYIGSGGPGATDHGALTGLADDDHTQYALLAGRSGGQQIYGGTASGNDLTIRTTSNATKGTIIMADDGGNVTMGTATPSTSTILTTRGTGTSDTTAGYSHKNSSGTQVFRIADSGKLSVAGDTTGASSSAYVQINNQSGTLSSTIRNQIENFHFACIGGSSTTNANLSLLNVGNNRGVIFFQKAQGTVAAVTAAANANDVGSFVFAGYDGTSFLNTGAIQATVSGTVSTGNMPMRVNIQTGETNTRTERFHVAPNGNIGIGYTGGTLASYILDINSTNAVRLPVGTTAQRPTTAAGLIRYNSSNSLLEYNNGSGWVDVKSIYSGSGTIASGAVATVTNASTFRINYNSANAAVLVDDVNNATTIGSDNALTYVYVSNTGVDVVDAHQINLTAAPSTDHSYSGITINLVANETHNFGDVVYIQTDGDAALADADATTTAPAVAMCTATVTATNTGTYMTYGVARDDTWAWTVGGLIYLSTTGTTGNTLTQTAPSGTGDVVQVVGIATHADRMIFNPSLTYSIIA